LPSCAVSQPDSLAAPRCKSMVLSRYSVFSRRLIRPGVRASQQHLLTTTDWTGPSTRPEVSRPLMPLTGRSCRYKLRALRAGTCQSAHGRLAWRGVGGSIASLEVAKRRSDVGVRGHEKVALAQLS